MLRTSKAVIVEGKYDKARLSSVVDALIITTDGFGIFRSKEKQTLIKKIAREKGIIILTDSDAAGFKIRNFLKNIAPEESVVHAYVPDIYGKEKRKAEPSKEGKLGVEGIDNALIEQALLNTGLFSNDEHIPSSKPITVADLFEAGLTGKTDSAQKRRELLLYLGLPARLTGKNMLSVLNMFLTLEDFTKAVSEIFPD